MDRDTLIQQVKDEYARLADLTGRGHITNQSYGGLSPEAYYEKTLEKAVCDISAGKYDDCVSGIQVVEHIANHRTKVQRIQDTIESTLQNMEIAEEMIAQESDSKKILHLEEDNARRAGAIPQMIRDMKMEQAREALKADGPNVIGGGNG